MGRRGQGAVDSGFGSPVLTATGLSIHRLGQMLSSRGATAWASVPGIEGGTCFPY